MKHNSNISRTLSALTLLATLSLSACAREVKSVEIADTTMSNNLSQIFVLLRENVRGGTDFPNSLASLNGNVNSNLFVCPGTGSKPGVISEIENWTDYIYVGGGTDLGVPSAALLISPPENHGGKHGYALFAHGGVLRLGASELRSLINDPFCLAVRESPDNLAAERARIIVNIPTTLRQYYPPTSVYPEDQNIVNLSKIWVFLREHVQSHRFPASLLELEDSTTNAHLFAFPGSGSGPRLFSEFEEWANYIYVGNVDLSIPKVALVISPAENHNGQFGYVLFTDATISRLSPEKLRQLIWNPFWMANGANKRGTDIRKGTTIHVPRKFRTAYSNANEVKQ